MSLKLEVKTGNVVKLFNGTFGIISEINKQEYTIRLENQSEFYHIKNIKYMNDFYVEFAELYFL